MRCVTAAKSNLLSDWHWHLVVIEVVSSALHFHNLIDSHHVLVQVRHDPEGTGEQHQNDQHAEGKRHDVVDVIWAGRDVEEEDKVYAHLRDGENDQRDGNARTPDKCGARDKEGHDGEQRREPEPNQVAPDTLGGLVSVDAIVARRGVRVMRVAVLFGMAHVAAPIKYTTVNNATQTM